MRDLSTQELGFVYGAGVGCSPAPPTCKPKKGKAHKGNSSDRKRGKGSRSGSRNRCGKGGSS